MTPINSSRVVTACLFFSLMSLAFPRLVAAQQNPPTEAPDYLRVVRTSVDALLERGVDRWGDNHTALIISILDRKTLEPPAKLPGGSAGVRNSDRTNEYGSNANIQQNLYRVMMLLSDLTDDPRYRAAAEAALVDLLRYGQSPETGLLGWGEHLFIDLRSEQVASNGQETPSYHEMKKKLIFWDLLHQREPKRLLTFARGVWDHQIYDHKTGDFSRHASWHKHGPRRGYDFTKEGGYMIALWSQAYEEAEDPVYRQAVESLARRYTRKLNERNLLDYDSVRPNYCNNGHNITLAFECQQAAERFRAPQGEEKDDATAKRLVELASRIDQGFLGVNHAVGDPHRGFIATSLTEDGQPCDRDGPGPGGYSVLWGMGYGKQTTAMVALHVYHRAKQLPPGTVREAYLDLFREAADVYKQVDAIDREKDVWACEPGMAILLLVAAHRETGDASYLKAAERLARQSVAMFWDESSPLPKASSRKSHYEAMTGADTLMLALLAVHTARNDSRVDVPISDLDK